MKKVIFCLLFLSSFFCLPSSLWAKYYNPTLKVLLFSTPSAVVLKDSQGLKADGITLQGWGKTRIQVNRVNSSKLKINNQFLHNNSLWVRGKGVIEVIKSGSASRRRYRGTIEVKPYAKGLHIINHIPVETYLEGLLNGEISTRWNPEVVKAQAVIARTFALHRRSKRLKSAWHLTAGQGDQVYGGVNIADMLGKRAIVATRGIVVNYKGKLAQTFYHSNCGGMTEDPGYLWKYSLPYLQIKEVPFGEEDPRYYWELTIPDWKMRKILKNAGIYLRKVTDIFISERTQSDRAYKMVFTGRESRSLLAADFRKHAGYNSIQSLLFDVIRVPGGFYFKGKGHGHGVGLCQWAAKEMADMGFSYDEILYFFYNDVQLQVHQKR